MVCIYVYEPYDARLPLHHYTSTTLARPLGTEPAKDQKESFTRGAEDVENRGNDEVIPVVVILIHEIPWQGMNGVVIV